MSEASVGTTHPRSLTNLLLLVLQAIAITSLNLSRARTKGRRRSNWHEIDRKGLTALTGRERVSGCRQCVSADTREIKGGDLAPSFENKYLKGTSSRLLAIGSKSLGQRLVWRAASDLLIRCMPFDRFERARLQPRPTPLKHRALPPEGRG